MQPSRDTREFPPQPIGSAGYPPGAEVPSSAAPADSGRSGGISTGVKIAAGLAVLLLVIVIGLVGLEMGLRNSLSNRLEKEASISLGGPVEVDFGATPVLLSMVTGSLSSFSITSSPDDSAQVPAIDLHATDIREEGDRTHMGSLTGTVAVSEEFMTRSAQGEQSATDPGSFIGGLTAVQSITANPDAGTLEALIGGIAEVTVVPKVTNGQLELATESATVLGFELPQGILGGTAQGIDDTLAEMPEGLEITDVHVVEDGMVIDLAGTDVVFDSPR